MEDGEICSFILLFICFAFQFSTCPDSLMLLPFQGRLGGFVSIRESVCNPRHFNKRSCYQRNSPLLSTNSPLPLSWEERGKAMEDGEICSFILLFILLFIRYAFHFFDSSRFLKLPSLFKRGAGGEFY